MMSEIDVVAVVAMKGRHEFQIVRTASKKRFQNIQFFLFLRHSQRIVASGLGKSSVSFSDQNGIVGIVEFSCQHFVFFTFTDMIFPFRRNQFPLSQMALMAEIAAIPAVSVRSILDPIDKGMTPF